MWFGLGGCGRLAGRLVGWATPWLADGWCVGDSLAGLTAASLFVCWLVGWHRWLACWTFAFSLLLPLRLCSSRISSSRIFSVLLTSSSGSLLDSPFSSLLSLFSFFLHAHLCSLRLLISFSPLLFIFVLLLPYLLFASRLVSSPLVSSFAPRLRPIPFPGLLSNSFPAVSHWRPPKNRQCAKGEV